MARPGQRRRFKQVDVFTGVPFKGNPLAVVLDADGLSASQMQAIARWTNLSETTFVLAPTSGDADYRVRIFHPGGEFAFAGHPTLGTAHALIEHGLVPRQAGCLIQECGVGLVPVDLLGGDALAFRAPAATLEPLPETRYARLSEALRTDAWQVGAAPLIVRMGIGWLVVEMPTAEACLSVEPRADLLLQLLRDEMDGVAGVALHGPYAPGAAVDMEVRAFFDKNGVLAEDPVTGSANACVAWVLQARRPGGYLARQGTCVNADGRVGVTYRDGYPWIGGQSITVIDGTLFA